MGNQKLKWTADEEAALLAGIAKYGTGKWKNILVDDQFRSALVNRSNIDLKDKWRNMNGSASGERPRSSKPTHPALPSSTNNLVSESAPALSTAPNQDATIDAALDDSPSESPKSKKGSNLIPMIFDALKASNNSKGSDKEMIARYIEEKYKAPSNLKKMLGSKLTELVAHGKLTKVENYYTIRNDSSSKGQNVGPKQEQSKPHCPQRRESSDTLDMLRAASETAAYKIAVAERNSFLAVEAIKEADRLTELAEEADCILEILKDIYERCNQPFAYN